MAFFIFMKFLDNVTINIRSGKGGDGCVSFRREKYVANGGPDGGDGGKGGDVIFQVDKGLNSLSNFRRGKKYSAENGQPGRGNRCAGKSGQDIILKVPQGTIIREASSGQIMADMSGKNSRVIVLKGGKGGLGNQHFATSRMQAPKYAKAGGEAIELSVELELRLIADVGLCGFPNAGKSTLLSVLSNAKPKIADYPFTTLEPMLGVVDVDDDFSFVLADIPGLIEGASDGVGLGHDFLRHVQRTRLLIHIVDAACVDGRDVIESIDAINHELKSFNEELGSRPQIIVANKMDIAGDKNIGDKIKKKFGVPVISISAATSAGIKELKERIKEELLKLPAESIVYEAEYVYEKDTSNLGYEAFINEDGEFVVEGPKIEKMLGYTNLETEKGFLFFTNFLKDEGILDSLMELGIEEGDTVRMYGHAFTYYP